jgi:hypothetical protein
MMSRLEPGTPSGSNVRSPDFGLVGRSLRHCDADLNDI